MNKTDFGIFVEEDIDKIFPSTIPKFKEEDEFLDRRLEFIQNFKGSFRESAEYECNKFQKLLHETKVLCSFEKVIPLFSDDPRYFLEKGKVFKNELKDLEKAIGCYDYAIKLNPQFREAYSLRGLLFFELKEFEKAINDFTTINEIDNLISHFKDETVYLNRGTCYWILGKKRESLEDYIQYFELDRSNAKLNFEKFSPIYSSYSNSKYEAIEELGKIIESDPKNNIAIRIKNLLIDSLELYVDDYEQEFREEDEINDQINEYFLKESVNDLNNKIDNLSKNINTLEIQRDNAYADLCFARAFAFCKLEIFDDALKDLNRIYKFCQFDIEIFEKIENKYFSQSCEKPNEQYHACKTRFLWDSCENLYNSGEEKYLAREFNHAIRYFDKLIKFKLKANPLYYLATEYRGLSLFYLEKYKLAILDFEEVLESDPLNKKLLNYRGLCYYYLEKYDLAILDFEGVLESEPLNNYIRYNRGLCYYYLEKYDLAILDFDSYLSDNHLDREVLIYRGLSKYYAEAYLSALEDFKIAININSQIASGWFYSGRTKFKLGMFQEARKDFKEAIKRDSQEEYIDFLKKTQQEHNKINHLFIS